MFVGYARVSSTGQKLDIQLDLLAKAGCEQVYQEKESGKSASNRHQLQEAIRFVRKGDCIVVTKLDRLARSMSDLWKLVMELESKGAALRVINQPEIDTTTKHGKVIITLLGYLADTERDMILSRTAEGRAKAVAAGRRMGRKPTLTDSTIKAIRKDKEQGKLSGSEIAAKHGISRSHLYRLLAAT